MNIINTSNDIHKIQEIKNHIFLTDYKYIYIYNIFKYKHNLSKTLQSKNKYKSEWRKNND